MTFNRLQVESFFSGMSEGMAAVRATRQMTLGKMIEWLKAQDPVHGVRGLGQLMSYRGYYMDLAFAPSDRLVTASVLLSECTAALGHTYEGYKGGDFVMNERTALWVAPYGQCGPMLMGFTEGTPSMPITEEEPLP